MGPDADEVDRSLDEVLESLTATLATAGWVRRDVGDSRRATFTRDLPGGLILGAEVARKSFSWPRSWPADISVRVGVGTESAMALLPLVVLPVSPLLLEARLPDQPPFSVSWGHEREGSNAVRAIVRHIEVTSERLSMDYPDVSAVLASMRERREPRAWDKQLELTLLAASGHADEARDLLATYTEGELRRSQRRFARQLTRWLDSGRTTVPPLAETLAVLPPEQPIPRFSRPDAKAKARARRAALDAVRAQARGKTQAELGELLTEEYERREVPASPGTVALMASLVLSEQRPFGRALSTLTALKTLKAMGTDGVHLVRTVAQTTTPDWLQRPERASYPARGLSRSPFAGVVLDPDSDEWLTQVSGAVRRLGQHFLVDVWLAPESDQLVAYVGPRRVGVIAAADVRLFDGVLRAAALFDEDPVLSGHLSRPPGHPTWLLEVQRP